MTTPLTFREPSGGAAPRGGVVVIQEAFGVTDHIVDVCRRFADAGWVAVAPHLFHRQNKQIHDYTDMKAAMSSIGSLKADEVDSDVDAALGGLAERGFEPTQCAIVGFCMGGTVAFHTAARRPLGAAATFYGGGIDKGRFGYPTMLSVADALQTPWHGFFGDLDKGIPTSEVEQLRTAAATSPVATDITRYAQGDHGFHCDDRPAVYNADASADAWSKTLDWFDAHVAR
ncbi:dienelactone hydrolase family protein [Rhodococcoides kyotonense]|uniref:Carboxymethylenebutenolidase n=1 Tax=Rhodococcoides kyotonense TaxID=398843 RepID=A0A177Y804_9NOCA|nr:dienelactone hydrolase family protein [Rhodococcus kyotonensis]OAK51581.1 carboxymethylenebutenolidase [Rhodococcus kyotonensis]